MGRKGSSVRLAGAVLALAALVGAAGSHAARAPSDHGIFGASGASVAASGAAALPSNFSDQTVFSGLSQPTVVRFAADGRVFVAEKGGLIKVFSSLSATTPTVVADLSTAVDNYWDRGLLGMALDPNFPTSPYVYVLYTYDAPIGGSAPRWNDACPTPPGPTTDGCVVSGRLAKLHLTGNVADSEQVLINDWCQQFPSHSIGSLNFGADGMLYVSGGDGASFNSIDYGQFGGSTGSPTVKNPCGDPPGGLGGTETAPTAEGGALRSQDLRTGTDPTGLNGAILRLDPSTGAAAPGNPLSGPDANAQRIVAEGLRNPFRFTIKPGTNEVWVGDVGWNTWEEIDRVVSPGAFSNFGWPCYEGNGREPEYDNANLNVCESLYSAGSGAVVSPYYTYNHSSQVVPGESCPTANGSSISGLAFYTGGSYPSSYNGALFFSDYTRKCIWVMYAGSNGLPDPSNIATFDAGAAGPVDLEIGPGGDLFYADYDTGTVRRIQYATSPPPPPVGLVAAYSFNEGSGTSVADGSGNGNAGSVGTAAWTTAGKYGNALSFNGTSAKVTIPDAAALHLTNAMTLEAWVSPTTVNGTTWRDVVYKGDDKYYLSGTSATTGVPAGGAVFNGSYGEVYAGSTLPLNTWSHLALTYDGATLRLYVNGAQVASKAQTGSMAASTNPLQIGGDAIYGQYFAGKIDEVRVYNTALTQAQVQTDMSTPIGASGSDTQPPTAPGNLTASSTSPSQINLSWTAAQDNVGVTGYQLERCQGTGCSTFSQIATPTGTTYSDTGLSGATSYSYRVRAVDAAGNQSAYSNVATTSTDTPPAPTIAAPSSSLTWKVGDLVSFSGSATDTEDGNLPASALAWTLAIEHCPLGQGCHEHIVQSWNGVATGSFNAPDHGYPSYLRLKLTATDSQGVSTTTNVDLQPKAVDLSLRSSPSGLQLSASDTTAATPFTKTVIQGSANTLSAPPSQTLNGTTYAFVSWSDGGAATHTIVANAAATYTATYQATADAQPPTAPANLVATAISSSQINLSWTAATDNVGVTQYRIERCLGVGCTNFVQIATTGSTTFADTGLVARTRYRYRVRAADAAGNIGPYSSVAGARTKG